MKMIKAGVIACLVIVALSSCATMLTVRVQKPAEIDTKGAKSIAVLPFGFPAQIETPGLTAFEAALFRLWYNGNEDRRERDLARYVENVFVDSLLNTKHFTVIKSDDLRMILRPGDGNTKISADAYITGRVRRLSSSIKDESYTDKKTNKIVASYQITVVLEVQYDVVLSATNEILGTRVLDGFETSYGSNRWDLEDRRADIAKTIFGRMSTTIQRQLAPWERNEYLALAEDKAKDKRMEAAKKYAEDGFVNKAFETYAKVYADTRNFAAGYNAALCKEALGDREGAMKDMENLANDFADKQALRETKRMQRTIDDEKAAARQKN